MQLNISTCYAMQIMLDLARNKKIVPSLKLTSNLPVSQRYVLQIAGKLRDGGLINAHAGMKGGYTLVKEASEISVFDVITLMEGDMSIPECRTRLPDCGAPCVNPTLYASLNAMKEYVDAYLQTITFDKLVSMDITGTLPEILVLIDEHIKEIKQK